jgi:putative tryptophan/tyrosine transport system substrate-binding protein
MKRRELIALLGGAAATWPLCAHAQQRTGKIPRVGFLLNVQSELVVALFEGLRDAGYIDGQSMVVETRFSGTMLDRITDFANELVALNCDVIFAAGPYAIQALVKATSMTPIVAIDLESDPIANGWASSIGRPGSNLTGFFLDLPELGGKQIELLKEAVPALSTVALLWDVTVGLTQFRVTEAAACTAGVAPISLPIQRMEDFTDAFNRAAREQAHAVVVLSSPLIFGQRLQIADLALNTRLPTISLFTLFPRSGGLMAYGPNFPEMWKRAATYMDRILKGAKAGDMPIERPSRFELVINLKTAKALGLDLPWFLQQRADEVIE